MKNAKTKQKIKKTIPKKKERGEEVKKPKKRGSGIVALKHKMVLDNMTGNLRKSKKPNLYQAMIDAGYSESYAKSCTQITETKDWIKLTEKYLPDNLLATTHNDLMIAKKLEYTLFDADVAIEEINEIILKMGCQVAKAIKGKYGTHCYYYAPDNRIRKDATDMAYKVKGKMAPEKFEVEQTGLQNLSDEELAALIKKQKARFTKQD